MPLFFGSLQAEARSAGGDRGTRKERSDGIAERSGASRFRCPIKERSGERGKVRNKKTSGKRAALFWIASSRSSKRWWNDSNVKRILFNALFEFAVWKIRTTIKLPIFPIAQHKFSTTSWANSLLYLLLHFINIFDMLIFCYGRIVF